LLVSSQTQLLLVLRRDFALLLEAAAVTEQAAAATRRQQQQKRVVQSPATSALNLPLGGSPSSSPYASFSPTDAICAAYQSIWSGCSNAETLKP
jgi:hypothetical protein